MEGKIVGPGSYFCSSSFAVVKRCYPTTVPAKMIFNAYCCIVCSVCDPTSFIACLGLHGSDAQWCIFSEYV